MCRGAAGRRRRQKTGSWWWTLFCCVCVEMSVVHLSAGVDQAAGESLEPREEAPCEKRRSEAGV